MIEYIGNSSPRKSNGLRCALTVVLVLLSWHVLTECVMGCCVTDADMWTGKNATDAANKISNSVSICKGCTAYFYAECTVEDDPQERGIKWRYDFGDGSSAVTHTTSSDDHDDTASHTYNTAGTYTATVSVCRDGVSGCSSQNASCTVYVVEVGGIICDVEPLDIVTDETITVLKGSKYEFIAWPNPTSVPWPEDEPTWSGVASGTGMTIDVNFPTEGNYTLTAKCGDGDGGKCVTIDVVEPLLDQVSFVDNNPGEEQDIDGVLDPVWTRESNPDNPASYTLGKKVKIEAKFWASQDLTYSTPVHVDAADTTGGFSEDTSVSFSTWPSDSTVHVSDSVLDDSIDSWTLNMSWKYKVPDGTNTWIDLSSGSSHTVYTVFGEPECGSGNYTKSNLEDAVGKADGAGPLEPSIASKANDQVSDDVIEDGGCMCGDGFQDNFDAAVGTPTKGMCCCRAEGLNCVLQVLGIGPYTHDYVNEWGEPNYGKNVNARICPTCGTIARGYWDGWWNPWEGVIKVEGETNGSTCYAPANGSIAKDEGTYSEINDAIADLGYHWVRMSDGQICTHQ